MDNYEHSDVLYHYGRKGMKWYQNIFGKKSSAAKAKSTEDKEKKKEETIEEKKTRILKSHDAEKVYKNKDLFTDKELQEAFLRLNMERNIKNLIPEKVSKGKKFLNAYSSTGKTVKEVVDTTESFYNSAMKVKKLIDATKKVT